MSLERAPGLLSRCTRPSNVFGHMGRGGPLSDFTGNGERTKTVPRREAETD
jgi:hypothetical protein